MKLKKDVNQALDGHLILVATMYELSFIGNGQKVAAVPLNTGGFLAEV